MVDIIAMYLVLTGKLTKEDIYYVFWVVIGLMALIAAGVYWWRNWG